MSATTEILLEEIKELEKQLAEAKSAGQPTVRLEGKLSVLRERLEVSNAQLNESKQILKG